jgi:ubiquinone/menaquinone biosynthesis C-methylase UbiE
MKSCMSHFVVPRKKSQNSRGLKWKNSKSGYFSIAITFSQKMRYSLLTAAKIPSESLFMNTVKNRQQIAISYSQLIKQGYFAEQFGGNEAYLGSLMTSMIPDEATSLLEVGGATGLWAAQMLKDRPNIQEITAVEISDAVQAYKTRLHAAKESLKLNLIQADFLQIAQDLKAVDVVASSYVAQYMENPSDYIRQLFDLTRPNGRVIFVDVMSRPEFAGGGISGKTALEAFFLVSRAYWQEHRPLPLRGFIRSASLAKLYQEPAFQGLNAYHEGYHFPLEAWKAEQARYPGAKFYNLGIAGLLMLPKPSELHQ